MKDKNISKLC